MSERTLRDCPFCGDRPEYKKNDEFWIVYCANSDCAVTARMEQGAFHTYGAIVDLWNGRVGEYDLVMNAIEQMEAEIERLDVLQDAFCKNGDRDGDSLCEGRKEAFRVAITILKKGLADVR